MTTTFTTGGCEVPDSDNWKQRQPKMRCDGCMWYQPKMWNGEAKIGRCRRHAPPAAGGWPIVFPSDWCGDHRIDEGKLR